MNNIEKAIQEIEDMVYHPSLKKNITIESIETILLLLNEKLESEKGCEYCKGGGNAESLIDGETTIFITHDDKVFCAEWGGDEYLNWEFCPMCGRKLIKE